MLGFSIASFREKWILVCSQPSKELLPKGSTQRVLVCSTRHWRPPGERQKKEGCSGFLSEIFQSKQAESEAAQGLEAEGPLTGSFAGAADLAPLQAETHHC
jgi:hypothetical protein